jgi:cathepsin L
MKVILLLLAAVIAIEANDAFVSRWTDFKRQHNKAYPTMEEESKRFQIFAENHRMIEEHNKQFEAGQHTFTLEMNQFGDLTSEEFRVRNGYKRSAARKGEVFTVPNADPAPDVDWRTKGYVTDVKDQKQCGSCWAFSATGSLEGQHFKKNGTLVSLSEQNLVDCSGKEGNEGCNGGLMDYAFQYILDNKGIDTEKSYPYEARDGRCRFKPANIGATDAGFVDIPEGDEKALTQAISTVGPISVAIDASRPSFQFYSKGVYYEPKCSSQQLDHGVLAVGYGATSDGTKYYIVKNSWGGSWGDKGYILMSRDKNNNCGIATDSSYPKV